MNTVHCMILGLTLCAESLICSAQEAKIPFHEIEQNAQISPRMMALNNVAEGNLFPSSSALNNLHIADPVSASGFVRATPVRVSRYPNRNFYLLNGMHLGMAMLDVGMTQRCMANHTCKEGNPMMPSSLAGQLTVNFAYVGYSSFFSHRLKNRNSRIWWISPMTGTVAHIVGAAASASH